ncbi:hypothetical protein FAIPA1_60005 [Frankia sp. AiPs1]
MCGSPTAVLAGLSAHVRRLPGAATSLVEARRDSGVDRLATRNRGENGRPQDADSGQLWGHMPFPAARPTSSNAANAPGDAATATGKSGVSAHGVR